MGRFHGRRARRPHRPAGVPQRRAVPRCRRARPERPGRRASAARRSIRRSSSSGARSPWPSRPHRGAGARAARVARRRPPPRQGARRRHLGDRRRLARSAATGRSAAASGDQGRHGVLKGLDGSDAKRRHPAERSGEPGPLAGSQRLAADRAFPDTRSRLVAFGSAGTTSWRRSHAMHGVLSPRPSARASRSSITRSSSTSSR